MSETRPIPSGSVTQTGLDPRSRRDSAIGLAEDEYVQDQSRGHQAVEASTLFGPLLPLPNWSSSPQSDWHAEQDSTFILSEQLRLRDQEAAQASYAESHSPDLFRRLLDGPNLDASEYHHILEEKPPPNPKHREIATRLNFIYRFFVRIGAVEESKISFGPHDFTYAHNKALENAGLSYQAITLLKMIPWPTEPLNLDWDSPAVNWSTILTYDENTGELDPCCGFGERRLPFGLPGDLKPSELALTQIKQWSLGYLWIIDADTGSLCRKNLFNESIQEDTWQEDDSDKWGSDRDEEQAECKIIGKPIDDDSEWSGDAVELLDTYVARLENLETIPLKRWNFGIVNPGFVTKHEPIYEDVENKLYEFGWSDAFQRDDWVERMPTLVQLWKQDTARYLRTHADHGDDEYANGLARTRGALYCRAQMQ
ncbi:uncharacterized protein HMPREF1541_04014 [Cyphellophora europaea CBS 101466]|uniref:Uncharacterized protein n=1 Tax=Cyphellophora europaea (strain CBS 101466) TaxID=1220924 RepID=W2S0F1_CYPE1|nr:uncharacterized protein HMPREF1541_04014 [Cyphellophora europaea CBS 101466]ETN42075.1 hypothetical protein HMPREF1541_04014 [Cyphellophora europaea CBS 101466]